MLRLVVAHPLRRQVAVDLHVRSSVRQAVSTRAARFANVVNEPLARSDLYLPSNVSKHRFLVVIARVVS